MLFDALDFTKGFVNILSEYVKIIVHCRKSVLFQTGGTWLNISNNGAFDVPQSVFNGAEISEIMGMNILNKFNEIVHIENNGMYSDDGLVIVPYNRRENDIIKSAS